MINLNVFFLKTAKYIHEKETKHKECKGDPKDYTRGISTKATKPQNKETTEGGKKQKPIILNYINLNVIIELYSISQNQYCNPVDNISSI
jgi:hypothetical protein